MLKVFCNGLTVVALATGLLIMGCGRTAPQPSPHAPQHNAKPATTAGSPDAGNANPAVKPETPSGLADLSPEDRAAAEAQKVCPVSGEALGSMGAPYKITVKGRDVFLCCSGCEAQIMKDPDKYLAKLPKKE